MPYFYPRSPCGERPGCKAGHTRQKTISIHALLAESDRACPLWTTVSPRFLSTLSLRRATRQYRALKQALENFYPRSPCGERHLAFCLIAGLQAISIHALLAESDLSMSSPKSVKLDFYPRSPCGERHCRFNIIKNVKQFLSTLSLRRATVAPTGESPAHRRFLSTLSLRRATQEQTRESKSTAFLSTLSLRRATQAMARTGRPKKISIHALLAESDPLLAVLPA